ncbi:MAG: hypothetical protein ACOZNI_05710 [Myxococcota bacterium]
MLLLLSCARTEVNVVVSTRGELPVETALLDLDGVVLEDCDGDLHRWEADATLDLLAPAAFSLPRGAYCALEVVVDLPSAEGALLFAGTLPADGELPALDVTLGLNPSRLRVRDVALGKDEVAVVVDVDALVVAADLRAAAGDEEALVATPGHPISRAASRRLPDAVSLVPVADGPDAWGDAWRFDEADFAGEAIVATERVPEGGCEASGDTGPVWVDTAADTATTTGDTGDSGLAVPADTSRREDTGDDGGGGCAGGDSGGSTSEGGGCDCGDPDTGDSYAALLIGLGTFAARRRRG